MIKLKNIIPVMLLALTFATASIANAGGGSFGGGSSYNPSGGNYGNGGDKGYGNIPEPAILFLLGGGLLGLGLAKRRNKV